MIFMAVAAGCCLAGAVLAGYALFKTRGYGNDK